MKPVFHDYDIYPKAFLGDREKEITIRPLGRHAAFQPGTVYTVTVEKVNLSNAFAYPDGNTLPPFTVTPDEDGCLRFTVYFAEEGEHYINVYPDSGRQRALLTLSVYSLAEDMAGRYPFRGDLHMHTCRSDGLEAPETVAANYRGHGYDFFTISDHFRYYPALEAIRYFGDLTDFTIVPGEEVHYDQGNIHMVNFGGSFSVNALVNPVPYTISPRVKPDFEEEDGVYDLERRSIDGKAPPVMEYDDFMEMIRQRAESVPRESEAERLCFATLEWIHEQVQAGDGLCIFAHPYWLCPNMHFPEDFTEFVYRQGPFDAFEVLGGGRYYQFNGYQTGFYYDMKAQGIDRAVGGSTDSHGSLDHYTNALIASTIVFARKNTREGLVDAIKEKYSLAVDTISKEYRLVGDFRLMKYGCFLMEHYFPIHDLACKAEGYYMNRYIAGDPRAEEILRTMKGQIPDMMQKYFDL